MHTCGISVGGGGMVRGTFIIGNCSDFCLVEISVHDGGVSRVVFPRICIYVEDNFLDMRQDTLNYNVIYPNF